MKTTANGQTAAKVNNESNNRVNIQALPAGEYGDLCYDYFGKGSVIVFGNTDDHAAQLEAIGGKYGDRLRYSALQNGRKWTEKQGRTAGYYFTTEDGKREAIQYVQRVNHAIFDKYEQTTAGGEHLRQKPADFKPGDRVRTIHGLGTVTEHTPQYNKAVSVCVKLDKFTYNYGWKGMPQTFIECRCDEITRYTPSEKSGAKTFQIGDRVKRNGTGATGTVTDYGRQDNRWTYIVKYDETQRRQSDGFEYLTEEVFENEIEPAPFFTAGVKYRCIRDVKGDFTKGKIYEQSSNPTEWFGYFRNDKGVHHVWPQPANIAHSCELYDMKQEDIDPRNYFKPVAA